VAELVDDVIARLSTQGVGSTSSTSTWRIVARDFLPGTIGSSSQAKMIAVTATGGYPQMSAEDLTYPTFQVRVRDSATASTGLEAKMTAVVTALNLTGGLTINSRKYLDFRLEGEPFFLGRDENQRPLMAANFVAWRSRTT
jgi:hypothetical protein